MELRPKVSARIELSALKHNYKLIQDHIGNTKQICVVKSDCYGHGTSGCIRALNECGCEYYAVSSIAEALEVRQYTDAEILILGHTHACDIEYAIKYGITQALFSHAYAEELAQVIPSGQQLKVHIKVDTGMNRIGYGTDEAMNIKNDISRPCFDMRGLFTHFATADEEDDRLAKLQLKRFLSLRDELVGLGVNVGMCHASNSAATFYLSEARLDAVRSGISLYGLCPSHYAKIDGLSPVMTLVTEVVHLHTVKKGEGISYGAEYIAERDMTVATLPVGYGDGFIRAYKGASVTVNGHMAHLIGRICMDQCMVDVTDIADDVSLGDEVILFGKGGECIDEQADRAGTINYESLCLITKRVPRIFI